MWMITKMDWVTKNLNKLNYKKEENEGSKIHFFTKKILYNGLKMN